MQQQMQGRSDALEAQARILCVQAQALYAVQQALEYRFNGQRLQMLELNAHPQPADVTASNSVAATATATRQAACTAWRASARCSCRASRSARCGRRLP